MAGEDLSEHLPRRLGQRLVVILTAVDRPVLQTYSCGVCGFAYNEYGEWASPAVTRRCKLIVAEQAREGVDTARTGDVASPVGDDDQVRDWLEGEEGSAGDPAV